MTWLLLFILLQVYREKDNKQLSKKLKSVHFREEEHGGSLKLLAKQTLRGECNWYGDECHHGEDACSALERWEQHSVLRLAGKADWKFMSILDYIIPCFPSSEKALIT